MTERRMLLTKFGKEVGAGLVELCWAVLPAEEEEAPEEEEDREEEDFGTASCLTTTG